MVNHHVDNISKRKVINWYLHDAENGDPEDQYLLSDLYRCNLSRTEGIQWLKKSADQGFSRAQYDLALVYQDENQAESLEYMKKAAKSYVYAQIELGYDYAHGTVVDKDYKKAYNLYQKAASNMKNIEKKSELIRINFLKLRFNAANDTAELLAKQGDIPALLYMGCLYQYGFEVKRNLKKAIFYYELAKNQGSKEACVQLEEIGNHVEGFVDSN